MPSVAIKLDSVTCLREGKRDRDPDPAPVAVLAELGGADAIVAYLGMARANIRDRDIYILKEIVKTRFILEIPADEQLLTIALEVKPAQVTFVSENSVNLSGALPVDYGSEFEKIQEMTDRLRTNNISAAHYIQPNAESVKNAARCKVDYVALDTQSYTSAESLDEVEAELDDIERMSQMAHKLGARVQCGGSLTYKNVAPLAELKLIEQITVGRAVIKRSMLVGIEKAVSQMVDEINRRL